MKEITSLSNPHIKDLALLKKNKVKKDKQMFLVDGEDFIKEAYNHHLLKEILFSRGDFSSYDVEKVLVTDEIIEKLSCNVSTSNVIGVCSYMDERPLDGKKYVYLDKVQDPGNVGTIIRTALAFSYDGVILSSDSASLYNDKVISASKGAIFAIPIYQDRELKEFKNKFTLLGTSLQSEQYIDQVNISSPFIIVLGNEGQGISQENLSLCDVVTKIDMNNIDSLNVAIAGGIMLYEFKNC